MKFKGTFTDRGARTLEKGVCLCRGQGPWRLARGVVEPARAARTACAHAHGATPTTARRCARLGSAQRMLAHVDQAPAWRGAGGTRHLVAWCAQRRVCTAEPAQQHAVAQSPHAPHSRSVPAYDREVWQELPPAYHARAVLPRADRAERRWGASMRAHQHGEPGSHSVWRSSSDRPGCSVEGGLWDVDQVSTCCH